MHPTINEKTINNNNKSVLVGIIESDRKALGEHSTHHKKEKKKTNKVDKTELP